MTGVYPFFVTGLPRSRTAWFSVYLNRLGFACEHELIAQCRTQKEFYERCATTGNSDSGLYLTDFQKVFPLARTVVIHRDREEVYESAVHLVGMDLPPLRDELYKQDQRLWDINGMHIAYNDINAKLRAISVYLVGTYDKDIADACIAENIQFPLVNGDIAAETMETWRWE